MNKKYLKVALIGLAAGFCLSGQAAPSKSQSEEVAMARCSKDNGDGSADGSGPQQRMMRPSQNQRNSAPCGDDCNTGTCKPNKSAMKQKRSAAQKVVQGS